MFLDIVESTTHLEKLTEDVVRQFIDKIVVHHRKEESGITTQKVEIYYNVILRTMLGNMKMKFAFAFALHILPVTKK